MCGPCDVRRLLGNGRGHARDGAVLGTVIVRRGGIYRFGAWAAWVAVYAFVLNAMLATTLLAATPVVDANGLTVLCLSHPDAFDGNAINDGATKRAASHCKLCLPGLTAALPPPAAPDVFARVAIAQPQQFAFEARLKSFARIASYSSRGPPGGI